MKKLKGRGPGSITEIQEDCIIACWLICFKQGWVEGEKCATGTCFDHFPP